MTPLTGLGIWIWELSKCEGGHVPSILAKAKACGVTHVIIKAGEERTNGQITPALVSEFRDGAVEPAIWWYCRPQSLDSQVAMLEDLVKRCGVRAIVMDSEREWDAPDNRPLALRLAKQIRAAIGPDCYFADAPWSRPAKHGGNFPYLEFGSICDARSPQFYWELAEVAGEAQVHFLGQCDVQWASTVAGQPCKLICPAGSAVDEHDVKHAAVAETAAFLDRYADRQSVSLWSWQHLDPEEWAMLEARAAGATPIADLLAGVEPPLDIPGDNT